MDLAEKCGVSTDGLLQLKEFVESWGELQKDDIAYHFTPAQWIHSMVVQPFFIKKYKFQWEKSTWDDIDKLPFTPEVS